MSRLAGWTRAGAAVGGVVVLDQLSKELVLAGIERGETVGVVPGLDLTNTRNRGVAFGALEGNDLVIGILIAVALALLIGYFAVNAGRRLVWLPFGLLLGGALGNLLDRARHGAVVDFIDPAFWPAFNVADASIVLGVPLLLLVAELGERKARSQP